MRGATVRSDLFQSAGGGDPAGVRRRRGPPHRVVPLDDFVEEPITTPPAAGDPTPFDRAALGEPLAWLVWPLRDHLAELLADAGFARVVADLDLQAISDHAEDIRTAMQDCVPDGYVRVPGVGLQLSPA